MPAPRGFRLIRLINSVLILLSLYFLPQNRFFFKLYLTAALEIKNLFWKCVLCFLGKYYHATFTFLPQFEKEEQVHSIDIGNEGSAFIEVLVGNSSAVRDQDYEVFLQIIIITLPECCNDFISSSLILISLFQVLLVTSSFMSPTESRSGTNMNRVRFFGPNQLQKSTAQEKWDRVKIVCSQPYSKVSV